MAKGEDEEDDPALNLLAFTGFIYPLKKKRRETIFEKALKVSLPHVGLTVLLLSYIMIGGWIFRYLEGSYEHEARAAKYSTLDTISREISDYTWNTRDNPSLSYDQYKHAMFQQLENFSKVAIEGPPSGFYLPPGAEASANTWNFRASMLYALTVISSTGYNQVKVISNFGRILSVVYGLVGIPLMFITAANIGKLLSELILALCLRLQNKFCPESQYCVKQKGPSWNMENLEVPAPFILALILGFCGVGATIYATYEPSWSFVKAYHVSFEGMISLSLEDLGIDSADYVILIMSYKILSLAVLTMCLDLARVKLMRLFRSIHFYGRKFKGRFGHEGENEPTDLASLLLDPRFRHILPEIIEAIYQEDPDRTDMLTSEDIFDYLRRLGDKQRVLRDEMNQAFVPAGYRWFKYVDADGTRRDSVAGWSSMGGSTNARTPLDNEQMFEFMDNNNTPSKEDLAEHDTAFIKPATALPSGSR